MQMLGIYIQDYKNAEFDDLKKGDRYLKEYLVQGTLINNCKLELCDVATMPSKFSKDGSLSRYDEIFSGIFAKIEFPKSFNNSIYLRKADYIQTRNSKLDLLLPEFESIFSVYATNQSLARQLLNNEILNELLQFYKDTNILCEFTIKENVLYIRYNCGCFSTKQDLRSSKSKEALYKYYKAVEFTLNFTENFAI